VSVTLDDLREGQRLPDLRKGPITRQTLVEWCAAENDYYHLHYDDRVAEAMGLPGPPIQGTFRYALLGQLIQGWAGTDAVLERIDVAYRGLDLEGDTISACGRVQRVEAVERGARVELEVWIENQRGERSTEGSASIVVGR
jgi:acyl dehydratase